MTTNPAPDVELEDERAALTRRLSALDKIVRLLDERVSGGAETARLREAGRMARRSRERLTLSAEHTVVALAGSTGSGKSTLFNTLVGLELSATGPRRPTTALPHACVWGPEGSRELLDWLSVPTQHQTARESALDAEAQAELRGLVLLDLPDHDSAVESHRAEVDRVVQLADLLVWVVDPQKYADAMIHGEYLSKMVGQDATVIVVLNQADTLTPEETRSCVADLRRLLDADGLGAVRVVPTTATKVDDPGVVELRSLLRAAVAERRASARRMAAELDAVAASLAGHAAGPEVRIDIDRASLKNLHATLAVAAGVSALGESVERGYILRASRRTSWPLLRWLGQMRTDPLRALRARLGGEESELERAEPVALSQRAAVHQAEVEAAVRDLATECAQGLPAPWPSVVTRAALSNVDVLPEKLDDAVARTDLKDRGLWWWTAVNVVQWVVFAGLLVGAVWLVGGAFWGLFGQDTAQLPAIGDVTVPAVLVLLGLVAGPLLAGVSRHAARLGAARARQRAEGALRDAVTRVAREQVLAPLRAELTAYADVRDAVTRLGQASPELIGSL